MTTRSLPPALALLAAAAVAGCGGSGAVSTTSAAAGSNAAAPAPAAPAASGFPKPAACRPVARTTPAETEGPFYKAGPPRRTSLVGPGVTGHRLSLRGRVLSTRCKPLAGARVDFWQADGKGQYDNSGYRLRGYQLTDASGRYRLETVVPGEYPGRTPHIHVKVTPHGGSTLTTQLYLPGVATNRNDSIFRPETVVKLSRGSGRWRAAFNFIVAP